MITALADPPLPVADAPWTDWLEYGLLWSRRSADQLTASSPDPSVSGRRGLRLHAYREQRPGPRWGALFDATWPGYRRWYLSEGEAARPDLASCRRALATHLPELLPSWEELSELARSRIEGTGGSSTASEAEAELAARMLSMWRAPAFAVNCSQVIVPGNRPVVVRNYDYDPRLFEAVIASTDYSGNRPVLGTSDMLWGLLDGMNADGLAVSLTYGGRGVAGEGFAIPIVIRYLLETCSRVAEAVAALRRIPVAQSYNLALADTTGDHATVFVAPGAAAVVSRLEATTNHFLDRIERPDHAARFRSLERQRHLERVRADNGREAEMVEAMLTAPLRAEEYDAGFGTLYTVAYAPAEGRATWHWPEQSWSRSFADPDEVRTVFLQS